MTSAMIALTLTCAADGVAAPFSEVAMASPPTQVIAPRVSEREVECLALTIYHEARGLSERGREAVGHVVLNRAANSNRSICAVVHEQGRRGRAQFSWTNNHPSTITPREARPWADAQRMARRMITERPRDFTGGATHFYNPRLVDTPNWAVNPQHKVRVEAHVFVTPRASNDNRRRR